MYYRIHPDQESRVLLPKRIDEIDSLLNPEQLHSVIGTNGSFSVQPLKTLGYSGSTFYAIVASQPSTKLASYLVKRTILNEDWFSQRIKDETGREGAVLVSTEFSKLYDIFEMPYLAVALVDGAVGLLMDDLSEWLVPDEREPILYETETLIIDHLARMHAVFWQNPSLDDLEWLLKPSDYLYIMGPLDLENNTQHAQSARGVDQMITEGWKAAKKLLPSKLSQVLWKAPSLLWEHWSSLPTTLLHGDTKLANFAIKPNGHLALFDWAFVGSGPCTFDIGWYVAVNASRLCRSKEELFEVYKSKLEKHLGWSIDPQMWQSLVDAGILCGALMLLWTKALAVENNRDRSDIEWEWWCNQLEKISCNWPGT
jgi:hypothetical protein